MSQVREYNHFDKPVNPNVDALRSRADAEHDEAPRLIVALTIAAHFDFCLRLKAFDGMLVASSVFCTRYELSTTSISGVPIGTLLSSLPLQRPAFARARAAALDYFGGSSAGMRRVLLGWRPAEPKEATSFSIVAASRRVLFRGGVWCTAA